MLSRRRVFITATGAICGTGKLPAQIWENLRDGVAAIAPIERFDVSCRPAPLAGEIRDFDARGLVPDRKLHKLVQRSDILGLHAADRAIAAAQLIERRNRLDEAAATQFSEHVGIFVGSGGGTYDSNYDYLPLLAATGNDLHRFGAELSDTVNPMWLLRTLPNNVLCHLGIRYGFKGPNSCITHHAVSGVMALLEAAAALRSGEADRTIAVAHHSAIEPQTILYFESLGLLAPDTLRPFDAQRRGTILGEGAAALVLEQDAAPQGALGEVLGGGCATEDGGLLSVRADGDGVQRAAELALADAGLSPAEIGCIVAHGSGTAASDASEARGLARVFGAAMPPVSAFKWSFGNLTGAAGMFDVVLALESLRRGVLPGVATLTELDSACGDLPVSRRAAAPRSNTALVLSRGFGGANAAVVLRAQAPHG